MWFSKDRIEKPLADWPHMKFRERENALHITGKYMAPSRWWQVQFPAMIVLLSLYVLPASCASLVEQVADDKAGSVGITYAFFYIVAMFVLTQVCKRYGRKRNLNIRITGDAIVIGGRRYGRAYPHQFTIEEHEKAFAEDKATGGSRRDRIFRDAVQVVLRYGEKRIPVADFRREDIRKAEALHRRLQFIDQDFAEMLGMAAQGDLTAVDASGARDHFGPATPIR